MNETTERMFYRRKCKHYSKHGVCALHSIGIGDNDLQLLKQCDGNCRRMKNFDKKTNQPKPKEFKINSITVNGIKYDIVNTREINCKNCDLVKDYGATGLWDSCPMCEHCDSLLGNRKIFKKSNQL